MTKYFICMRAGRDRIHFVHKEGCPFLPEPGNRFCLGNFRSPRHAIEAGKKYFSMPGRCIFCSKENRLQNRKRLMHELFIDTGFISSLQMNDTPEDGFVCSVN